MKKTKVVVKAQEKSVAGKTEASQALLLGRKIRALLKTGEVVLTHDRGYFYKARGKKPCGCAIFVAATATDNKVTTGSRYYNVPVLLRDKLVQWGVSLNNVHQLEMGFEGTTAMFGNQDFLTDKDDQNAFYKLGVRMRKLAKVVV